MMVSLQIFLLLICFWVALGLKDGGYPKEIWKMTDRETDWGKDVGREKLELASTEALVKAQIADARRTYSGFAHCQEALKYAEDMILAAIRERRG